MAATSVPTGARVAGAAAAIAVGVAGLYFGVPGLGSMTGKLVERSVTTIYEGGRWLKEKLTSRARAAPMGIPAPPPPLGFAAGEHSDLLDVYTQSMGKLNVFQASEYLAMVQKVAARSTELVFIAELLGISNQHMKRLYTAERQFHEEVASQLEALYQTVQGSAQRVQQEEAASANTARQQREELENMMKDVPKQAPRANTPSAIHQTAPAAPASRTSQVGAPGSRDFNVRQKPPPAILSFTSAGCSQQNDTSDQGAQVLTTDGDTDFSASAGMEVNGLAVDVKLAMQNGADENGHADG